ncbi:putative phosphatase [Pseudomonas aeruginosa]|nr:putative phosphatase [Pseudomonas aeruginosa]
MNDLIAGFV